MLKRNHQILDVSLVHELGRKIEKVRETEERLKILFEYAPIGYFLSDLKGTVLDNNQAGRDLCGYKKEEMIGKNMLELNLLAPGQIKRAAKLFYYAKIPRMVNIWLKRDHSQKPPRMYEFTFKHKDGRFVELELRIVLVKIKGDVFVLGIARDITKQKWIQEKLKQQEEIYERELKELKKINEGLKKKCQKETINH